MEIIMFFTSSERLADIGVIFPWEDNDTLLYKVQVTSTKEVWVVWHEIDFDYIKQSLDAVPAIQSYCFVYHNLPVEEFLQKLESYLSEKKISFHSKKSNQIPNTNCIYEELKDIFPNNLNTTHFTRIKNRIQARI